MRNLLMAAVSQCSNVYFANAVEKPMAPRKGKLE